MTTDRRRVTKSRDRVDLIVARENGEWDEAYARRLILKNPQLAESVLIARGVEYELPEDEDDE